MSSRPRSVTRSLRRKRSSRRRSKTGFCRAGKSSRISFNGGRAGVEVGERLETLKNLIPPKNGEMKADSLLNETANYIVLLRTQVDILQRLIEFYGSN
ncbi:hypothetical protein HHK36_015448 [Tetracentron sinense]|uniref:Uncharacterized protein n=1 Tax=Tetracentron sinense TaxID=13715 RepID=A0A834Z667_TETSI|nr:hypothetical protein HHK36_015448 [Tetracentron sinense]